MNEYRKEKKLAPLPFSSKLTAVAQAHAKDLSENYAFDPKGKCNPHSWSKEGAWTPCCYTNDHKQAQCMWDKPKEIAGYEGSGYEIAYYNSGGAKADKGLEGWKKSPAHNPLIINSGMWEKAHWQGVGIGIYKEYAVVWFGEVADEQNQIITCNLN
ncbi:CAP domain-containing protein [Fulvivirga maritima]|uniref:CAP domain-containing protein n=1 Tax=Fulvivirga maritima TaxID=2904247 RepID=UPI001F19E3CD|nr:CAP domain-containing protein [Fulvivirga maritima]UII29469.1 CAP domain-containing protein [Fulvivirga maritima]